MNLEEYIEIGVIGKAKSFKGEVFFHLKSLEFKNVVTRADALKIPIGNKLVSYPIANCYEKNGNTLVVKFNGIDSKDMAELIKNKTVYLPFEHTSSAKGEELYSHELANCKIVDKNYGNLGKIKYIDNSTPQLLVFIDFKGSEAIFPLNDSFIQEINLQEEIIYTALPQGILEINE